MQCERERQAEARDWATIQSECEVSCSNDSLPTLAIPTTPTLEIKRVKSAAECEALNPEGPSFHGYTYDSESCTCFYWDDMLFTPEYCAEQDPRTPIENPLEGE